MTEETNAQEETKQTDAQLNFEKLRKQMENERYAREQAEMRARQYEEQLKEWEAKQSAPKEEEEDDYDEPYIDEKRLSKKFKSWEEEFDKKIDKKAEEKARALLEQERQANFLKENKDFEKVMSPELLQKFVDTYPDIAEGILQSMPDDFNRKKHVYKTIKSLKLHLKPEEHDQIDDKIKKNQQSGLYQPSGISPSPYKAAGDFSKAGQQQAYEQMEELASRFGGGGVRMS